MSKNIVRVNKTKNYTVMSNKHLNDKDLSWKAKGIHSYILSLPDDWKIIISHLETMAKDGEKSLRSGIKELYDSYYWQKYPIYKNGKVIKWITEIYEEPFPKEQKVKSVVIKNSEKETRFEHVDKTKVELLPQNVEVGKVEVEKVEVEKDRLLNTNGTKDSFVNNHSSIQDDRLMEYKKILKEIYIEEYDDIEKNAIDQAIRLLVFNSESIIKKVPQELVKNDLKKIDFDIVDRALKDYYNASENIEIENTTAYLAKCIYNAIFSNSLKIQNELRRDGIIY